MANKIMLLINLLAIFHFSVAGLRMFLCLFNGHVTKKWSFACVVYIAAIWPNEWLLPLSVEMAFVQQLIIFIFRWIDIRIQYSFSFLVSCIIVKTWSCFPFMYWTYSQNDHYTHEVNLHKCSNMLLLLIQWMDIRTNKSFSIVSMDIWPTMIGSPLNY
jgi:hypothetical protein